MHNNDSPSYVVGVDPGADSFGVDIYEFKNNTHNLSDSDKSVKDVMAALVKTYDYYVAMREKCTVEFSTVTDEIMEYNKEINLAKTQTKMAYFAKKRTKSQDTLIDILNMMDSLDAIIAKTEKRLQELLPKANGSDEHPDN